MKVSNLPTYLINELQIPTSNMNEIIIIYVLAVFLLYQNN